MAQLVPVDHDPFADAPQQQPQGGGFQLVPVDGDPFAKGAGGPKSPLPMFAQNGADQFEDMAKSGGVGVAKGASGILGTIGALGQLWDSAPAWLAEKAVRGLEKTGAVEKGMADKLAASVEQDRRAWLSPAEYDGTVNKIAGVPFATPKGFDSIVQSAAGSYYEPKTKLGQYAQTVGEFLPGGAIGPGGMSRLMPNMLAYGVAPGVASEAAGQATAGTALEPWARAAAAIGTAGGAALASAPAYTERMAGRAVNGVTEQQFGQAQQLMRDAEQRGIRLTVDEAVQQVTGGASNIGNLRRVVESTTEGGQRFAPVMAERPGQMRNATDSALDQIAPRSAQPSNIGPQMQEAGQGAIDRVRQNINRLSSPYYQAAEGVRIPPNEFAQMASLPGFEEALQTVRNTPQLNRTVAHLPDDSVGVLNEIKKQLDTMGSNAASAASPTRNMQVASGYERDARSVNQMGRNLSPEYSQALDIQAAGRSQVLDPLAAGPVGQIAGGSGSHVQQGEMLMGAIPSPQEVRRATGNLMAENPSATRDLVRERLGQIADRTVGGLDTQARPDQFGGAKFAREVRGNGREAANIDAAIRAASGDATADSVSRLVDVLQATGQRQRAGSLTAFNQEALGDLKRGGLQSIVQAISKPLQTTKDAVARRRMGSQAERLAEALLAGPDGVTRLRDIAQQGTGGRNALLRALMSGGTALSRSRD